MTDRNSVAWAAVQTSLEQFRQQAGWAERVPADEMHGAVAPVTPELQTALEAAAQLAAPSAAGTMTAGPRPDRLEAVTERLALSDEERARHSQSPARYVYPLVPLQLSEAVFPQLRGRVAGDGQALWAQLAAESERLPRGSLAVSFDSLLHLLRKYTWCLPSPADGRVSLYDHCRVTAALAVCLHGARAANAPDKPDKPDKLDEPEFLLIEGGVSGIQQFIYNPAFNGQELQDGMARRLRGRSFYVHLLVKTLADYVNETLGLTSANILWATGGHFLIVAPNTAATRASFDAARKTIQQWLWREFRGALGLLLAEATATRAEIGDFSQLRTRLEQALQRMKFQQVAAPLSFGEGALDGAWQNAWVLKMQDGICRDTGRDLSTAELQISLKAQKQEEGEAPPPPRSAQSLLFDCIGRVMIKAQTMQLRRADAWQINGAARLPHTVEDAEDLRDAYHQVLIEFPDFNRVWLLTDEDRPRRDAHLCLRIADHRNHEIKFLPTESDNPAPTTAQGFEFLADAVKTKFERGRGRLVHFHELADEAVGVNFLGALRMDVDNLGYAFAEGLPTDARSLAQVAGLSRMMDWFFTGYLNTLIAGRSLYTTYAGGDDLFIVGPWDQTLVVAEEIQQQFSAFCGGHPDLHISAGIALCKGRYPIGHAAEEAAEKLDGIAKSAGKNALAFLETRIPWQQWPALRELGDQLVKEVEDKKVSRKFVYNLLTLYQQHIDPRRDPGEIKRNADLVWLPKFLYSLVRNVNNKELCTNLQNTIPNHQDYLSVLAGYVLLKTRSSQNKTAAPASAAL